MRALVSLLSLLLVFAVPTPAATAAADPIPVTYRPPVSAPVSDPFRPPATPYGPGNRGIEYATSPGDGVGAAAAGTVSFAGPVAGRRYVTVLHADGVRTAYGPLARIDAQVRDVVEPGERLGTTAGPLLWTARVGDAYVDPAVLLAASGRRDLRLVAEPGKAQESRPRALVSSCSAEWALARPC